MSKKYLVTGGTGFLGAALVEALLRQGNAVRVLDNDWRGSQAKFNEEKNLEFVKVDIRDADAVAKACKGVEVVCHLAFINGTEFFYNMPELVLDVGVNGMSNILNGAIKAKVPEFVLASSSEVYQTADKIPTDEKVAMVIPDPLNPRYSYAGGKIISELMAINYGRKHFERVVIFRPHNVYGPAMGWEHVIPQFVLRIVDLLKNPEDPLPFSIQGSGRETRSFIHIEDFTRGLMKVIEKGEHLNIYHIGTTEEVSIADLATKVGQCFGRELKIIPGGLSEGSTPRRCPDIGKLKALGFTPQIPLAEGLRLVAKWYQENAHRRPRAEKGESK